MPDLLVDVLIPTCPQHGGDLMRQCIATYERTPGVNVIVVENSPTCGAGWIEAFKRSTAPYVHLSADDIEPRNPNWLTACMEAADEGVLPCPVVWTPNGLLESCGGNMSAEGCLNRSLTPDRTPADFGGAPFLTREQMQQIGMLPIQVCSDVWVHYRGRQLGYASAVVLDFELTHYRPSSASNVTDLQVMNEALARAAA